MKAMFSILLLCLSSLSQAECIDDNCLNKIKLKPSAANDCSIPSAVDFAKSFYLEHYYFFAEPDPKSLDQLYTEGFKKVVSNHAECVRDNGFCNIDYDPWTNAQDGDIEGDIDYSIERAGSDSLFVNLSYMFRVHPSHPASRQSVSLALHKESYPLCWKIDDMLMPDKASMKTMMTQDYEHFYYSKKTKLSWGLLASDFDSSQIAVKRDDKVIREYEVNCDMSEALQVDPDQLEGERNKIGLVTTPYYPKGLFVSSCRVGAHSKELSLYDLSSESRQPVWTKIGSYFGEWSINQNFNLVLSYDEPCSSNDCEYDFVTKDVIWMPESLQE